MRSFDRAKSRQQGVASSDNPVPSGGSRVIPDYAHLVPINTSADARARALDKAVTLVGRSRTCDLRLGSASVAKVHSVIINDCGHLHLVDLSGKGVEVAGGYVHERPLCHDDHLSFGKFAFKLDSPSEGTGHPRVEPVQATLVGKNDTAQIGPFELLSRVSLMGSDPACDVVLPDDRVAPVQCLLVRTGRGVYVRDLQNDGQTRVNGAEFDIALLDNECEISTGPYAFRLESTENVELPAPHANAVVLVVDPDWTAAKQVERILAGAGYAVRTVRTGGECLAQLAQEHVDLVLADAGLPDIRGVQLCKAIRSEARWQDVAVMLMADGALSHATVASGLAAGACDLVAKPPSKMELLARIDARLREKRARNRDQEDIVRRKHAEERSQERLGRMGALRTVDMAITASLDLRVTLGVLLDQTTSQLGVHAATVLLLKPHTQVLEYAAGRGLRTTALRHTHLRIGEGYAGRAAMERRIINIPDLAKETGDLVRAPMLTEEGFVAYYAAPLIAKGQVRGVLEIFHREELDPNQDWLDFLESLAGQAAVAIDNVSLFEELQQSNAQLTLAYDTTLEGWSRALDLRDKETEGHTQRVTEMTLRLARAMGISEAELVHIRRGALLHDMGKMGIPDSILLKPGPLTEDEWEIMRKHPTYAVEMLSPIAHLRPALDVPHCHHEKWDGTGYPRQLKGEEIPLAARIFAVVDIWDALCSDRPYRKAWPEEKVRQHIRSLAGTHLDSRVVDAFMTLQARCAA